MTENANRVAREPFWSLVQPTGFCWEWLGARGSRDKRYGVAWNGRRQVQTTAHRVAYELLMGPIPDGLHLDHLCRNALCVNPDHLDPVTEIENKRRRAAILTRCRNGHEYTDDNTYVSGGERVCRACSRERQRKHRARQREGAK